MKIALLGTFLMETFRMTAWKERRAIIDIR